MATKRPPGDQPRALPPPDGERLALPPPDAVPEMLPYGMRPAPIRKDTARFVPTDLGRYDPDLDGWCVVYDPGAPIMLVAELAEVMADTHASNLDRVRAMQQYLDAILVAWNFTRIVGDALEALPQPRAGGAAHCPQHALKAIGQGFADAVKPPKG